MKKYFLTLALLTSFTMAYCQAPTASFTFSPACDLAGSTVTFTNTSTHFTADVWVFGDPASGTGDSTSSRNATHIFQSAGTYTVTLYVSNGVAVDSVKEVVTVVGASISPSADTICGGGSATLTASGGTTYAWSNFSNKASITVSPFRTTTYTVTVSSGVNCSATASATVQVNPPVVAAITPATSRICSGQSVVLTASSRAGATNLSYAWSNGNDSASITVSPATTTTYTVTVSEGGNCTSTASATISVTASPGVTISPSPDTICSGTSTTLTANSSATGINYLWSTGSDAPSITVSPTANTSYSVTVSTAGGGGCSASASNLVVVNALPAASINPASTTICANTSATLTASGGGSYLWSTGSSSNTITVSPQNTKNYTVTVTSTAGCSATAGSVVTVSSGLTVSISPANSSVCLGDTAVLTASAGQSYTWSTGATTQAISISPTTASNYTVTVNDGGSCTGTATTNVAVNSNPIASINPATDTVCSGGTRLLTASGGTIYAWSTGANTASTTVTPTGTTTYTVTVSNATGCSATASRVVVVADTIVAAVIPASDTVCAGTSVLLTASGGGIYTWSTGANTIAIEVTPAQTTTYTVTVMTVAGCSATTSATVNVTPGPPVTINPAGGATICNGASVTLTASGAVSYLWSTGSDSDSTTVSPNTFSVFTVTATGANGCQTVANERVTVTPSPVIVITPSAPSICIGSDTTLTASGANGYQWSTGDRTPAITVTGVVTRTYTVSAVDFGGCSATAAVTVTVDTLPVASIVPATDTVCSGALTTLIALGGSAYNWSNGGNTEAIFVNPTATTNYVVKVLNSYECSATAHVNVVVKPLPQVTIAPGNTAVCVGSSVTLTASGGLIYNWSNASTSAAITVNPTVTTTYDVSVTAADGCTASDSATVNANAALTPTISPANATLCAGDSVTLTVTSGATYAWNNNANSQTIRVSPAATSTYTVTVTNGNGCSGTASVSVTVVSKPTVTISPSPDNICIGNSTTLTASGGLSYAWSTGSDSASITVSPAATTSYTVTVTNGNGCSATGSGTVTVNPIPVIFISPQFPDICSGTNSSLTAEVTGVTGNSTYAWSDGNDSATITISPNSSTVYSVTVTSAAGCTATSTRSVTVSPTPVATISPATDTICNGASVTLTASGGVFYRWSTGGGFNQTITVTPAQTTTYTVTVANIGGPGGCATTASVNVVVNQGPILSITPASVTICSGTNVTLTANTSNATILWSNGGTTPSIIVDPTITTNYTATATASNGCSATATRTVTVNPVPVVTVSPANAAICAGKSVTITAAASGTGNRYLWSTSANTPSITVSPTVTTNYVVTVSGTDGCSATASSLIVADPALSPVITPSNPTICTGNVVTISVTSGSSYTWSNGASTQNITVSPNSTTAYIVTVTNGSGCSGTAEVNVNVSPGVAATISPAGATICIGTYATLTASGGTNYTWSNGNDSASITVSPVIATVYTVTVSDSASCSATASAEVVVRDTPYIAIAPPNAVICAGGTVTLTAVGGGGGGGPVSYLWNTGSPATVINVTPVSTANYTVTITNLTTGCTNTALRTVTVNPAPVASISPATDTICAGNSTTLTASGGAGFGFGAYRWNTGAVVPTITVSPLITTGYVVTVSGGDGCTAVAARTVVVNPTPAAAISPAKDTICGGSAVLLTASGGGTYLWSTGTSGNQFATSPANTTTYTVTVTGSDGCTASASSTITVNNVDAVITPPVSSLCLGQSDTLKASGGQTYLWSTGSTATSIIITPDSSSTYSVVAAAGNQCTSSATATVSVNPTLIPVITPAQVALCYGGVVTLSVSPGTSYRWSNGATTQNILVAVPVTTTYSVTVSNGNGCSGTASVTISVNGDPTPAVSPAQTAICRGQSTTLTASGGVSYAWSTGSTAASISVSPATSAEYVVTVTNAAGCSATAGSTVTVNTPPTANIFPPVAFICSGGTTVLTANGGSTYLWSNGATTAPVAVSPTATITYTVTVTSSTNCTASASREVTVTPVLAAVSPTAQTICAGQTASLTASGANGFFGGYKWNTGSGNATINVNPGSTTTYTVTVTAGPGCTATASGVVTVNSASASITPATDSICAGGVTTLAANSGTAYNWSDGSHTQTTTVSPTTSTNYSVTVTGSNGCSGTASRTVVVKAKPTVSTTPGIDTICGGHSVSITAIGTGSYAWSSGPTTQTISVSPTTSTNYTVTLTGSDGCTAASSAAIIVRAVNASIFPPVSAICIGQSDTLTVSGGTGYIWSTGSTASSIIVSPTTTTNYTVTATGTNGCTAAITATVNVSGTLTPVITPSNPAICPGGNVTLVVTAGETYSWSNGFNTQSVTVTPANTTSYTVTVNNGPGCTGVASVTVTVNSSPVATISPANDSVCSGFSTLLTASGGNSYTWSNTDTGAIISITPVATGPYSVTVTDQHNCSASATETVTVVNNPSASVNPGLDSICLGQSATLKASGGGSYSWSNNSNTRSITVSPQSSTTYIVTVTGTAGCTATASAQVAVKSLPQAAITLSSNAVCNGQSDTLTATGGTGYVWSTGSDSASTIVSPASTTTYTVTVTGSNNCSASATASLTVNALPVAAISPESDTICSGGTVTLTASGGGDYSWSINSTSPAVQVNPTSTTTYVVTVTSSQNCSASASGTVVVNGLPAVFINPASASICTGNNVTLTAIGGINYVWSNASTLDSITVSPATTTTYKVTATDINSCSATASARVKVNANPTAAIAPPTLTICRGTGITLTASGGGDYNWSNNASTAVIVDTPSASNIYSVTVTNPVTGCSATASSNVTVDTVAATISPALSSVCTGQSVTITASGGTYVWSNNSTASSITVSPLVTTAYQVTVTATNNCSVSLSATVNVNDFLVPVITPANPAVCVGSSVQLTVTAATTYSWSNGSASQTTSVSPQNTTTYTVSVTEQAGCSGTASVEVTVYNLPTPVVTQSLQSICSGQSDVLTASGGITYAWSTGDDTSVITVSPNLTAQYDVTVTDTNTCSASAIATVTVFSTPAASVSPASDTICAGQSANLTAGGGTNYVWSDNETTASISDFPTSTTTYIVTVTNGADCSATASAVVTVNAQPTATVSPDTIVVCNGQSGTFTAYDSTGTGTNYSWSDGEINNTITVSPASTTTYTVTISSVSCSATATGLFIVNSIPDAAITPTDAAVCTGASTSLTASGGGGYAWSTGDNTASITVSPTGTTTYTVTVNSSGGCTATASASVSVNTPPNASVSPASTVTCSGSNTVFTANGGVTYNWSNNATSESVTVNPTATTVYVVTVTDVNGCTATASGTANVLIITAAINPGASTTCPGQAESLTASGGVTYTWSNGNDSAAITVSPSVTTNFTVTATDDNGCTATALAVLNVNSAPDAAISPTVSSICSGQSATLTASGGGTYSWSTNDNTGTVTVSPTTTTTYTVTVTGTNNCSATASAVVNVGSSLTPVISPASPAVCPGGSVTLNVTSGNTYSWSTGETTESINVSPTSATGYSVTVSNGGACSGTASVNVAVNSNPDVTFSPASSFTVCSGLSEVVTANGGVAYAWSTGNDTATVVLQPTASTTYTVTVTDANGCSATGAVQVNTIAPTTTTVTAGVCTGGSYLFNGMELTTAGTYTDTLQSVSGCDSVIILQLQIASVITDTLNISICQGSYYTFDKDTLTAAGTYTDSLVAQGGCDSIVTLNLSIIAPASNTVQATFCADTGYSYNGQNYTTTGTFIDTVKSSLGCDSLYTTLQLTALSSPTITWLVSDTICDNNGDSLITIPAAMPAGGTYAGTGVSGDTIDVGPTGSGSFLVAYTLIDTNSGCATVQTKTFVVENCLGISKLSIENAIMLYPNPASEVLTIESSLFTADSMVPVVHDLSGNAVRLAYTRSAGKFVFNTQSLAAGVYFVQVQVQGNVISKKFVKID
jgi:antitoxin (DNA-binding transcriptional repressor) of toxin-antitoxin stability system/predicted transcriptional regulator